MTEKRFYLNEGEVGILKILDLKEDNEAIYHTASKSDMKMVVELFNRLSEENEQLKQDIENLKTTLVARETLIDVCEKKFKELGYIITVDDDGYVIVGDVE